MASLSAPISSVTSKQKYRCHFFNSKTKFFFLLLLFWKRSDFGRSLTCFIHFVIHSRLEWVYEWIGLVGPSVAGEPQSNLGRISMKMKTFQNGVWGHPRRIFKGSWQLLRGSWNLKDCWRNSKILKSSWKNRSQSWKKTKESWDIVQGSEGIWTKFDENLKPSKRISEDFLTEAERIPV